MLLINFFEYIQSHFWFMLFFRFFVCYSAVNHAEILQSLAVNLERIASEFNSEVYACNEIYDAQPEKKLKDIFES